MTGTKVWLFDWFRFPPLRVLLESTRYSTIPEESRKACNRPAQYGFVGLSEHVVYPPLCGSKFKTLDFKANNRKPWHPRLCLRKSSKAALSLGCGKAGEGQKWTKHTRTVFEKIQQPIFEWAFLFGVVMSRCGAVRLRCSLISAGCRDESTFKRASHRCRPAWANGRLSWFSVLWKIWNLNWDGDSGTAEKHWKAAECKPRDSVNHAVCFSNQRSHLNRNPVGSATKTIFKAMVTGCPSVEYASLTASNIAYHFSHYSLPMSSHSMSSPSPCPTWSSSDNAMLPKSRWASGCVLKLVQLVDLGAVPKCQPHPSLKGQQLTAANNQYIKYHQILFNTQWYPTAV